MSEAFDKPPIELPPLLRGLNALGGVAGCLGLGEIPAEAEWHLRKAEEASGLSDYGPYDIREPLQKLLNTLREEADLSLFGRIASAGMTHRNLMNVLAMQDVLVKTPEVASVDVERPIIIICTPRTGRQHALA